MAAAQRRRVRPGGRRRDGVAAADPPAVDVELQRDELSGIEPEKQINEVTRQER